MRYSPDRTVDFFHLPIDRFSDQERVDLIGLFFGIDVFEMLFVQELPDSVSVGQRRADVGRIPVERRQCVDPSVRERFQRLLKFRFLTKIFRHQGPSSAVDENDVRVRFQEHLFVHEDVASDTCIDPFRHVFRVDPFKRTVTLFRAFDAMGAAITNSSDVHVRFLMIGNEPGPSGPLWR